MEADADPRLAKPERLAALWETGLLDSPVEESFDRLTRLASRLLGVPVALVSLVDDHRQFFKSAVGLAEPWSSRRGTPLSHSFCQHVVVEDEPLVVVDAHLDARVRDNLAIPDLGVRAYAGVPLRTREGHVLGSFCAIDSRPHHWTAADLEVLEDLAASVMSEIELRVAISRQRLASEELAESRNRLGLLADLSGRLAQSLDVDRTVEAGVRFLVAGLADVCLLDLIDDRGRLRRAAVASRDGATTSLSGPRPAPTADSALTRAVEQRRLQLVSEPSMEEIEDLARSVEEAALLRRARPRAFVAAPLLARGHLLGAVVLLRADAPFRQDELSLVGEVAHRLAIAVDNAVLHQASEESSRRFEAVAATLQESLLPAELPRIPGLELAAHYRPAEGPAQIGGDFYDVYRTARGRWVAAIGDVCGKGVAAARLTALARYTLRAGAMQQSRPADVLAMLNQAILDQRMEDGRFLTAAYATIRPVSEGARLQVASAGHPPPLVLRADGTVKRASATGTLLGVVPSITVRDSRCRLGPGDAIFFCTDGVLEARNQAGELFGEERLVDLLGGCVGLSAPEIVDVVDAAARDFSLGANRDDTALLAIRVTGDDGADAGGSFEGEADGEGDLDEGGGADGRS